MLQGWEKQFPGRIETIFSSLQRVSASQLADTELYDFVGLTIDRSAEPKDYGEQSAINVFPPLDDSFAGNSLKGEQDPVKLIEAVNLG